MGKSKHVYLSLELSPEMDERLDEISAQLGSSRADVLRKAIALIDIATRAKLEGLRLGIVAIGDPLATEIVGV